MWTQLPIHRRPACMGTESFAGTGRRNRRPSPQTRARFQLERLEDRHLLSIAEFPLPGANRQSPLGIVAGPDGNIWFADSGNGLGMINPTTHAISEFSDPAPADDIGITAGPDGNLWFTDAGTNAIGTINPTTHVITKFAVPTSNSSPYSITAGPDGNLWFTELGADKIGMINPTTHAISEFSIPTAGVEPWFITAGPDGHLWFTELSPPKNIGEIDPTTDVINEFPMPATHGGIGITAGPDGNLWVGDGDGEIGQVNAKTGSITEFPIPANHPSWDITAGPDGNLWFSENLNATIGEFNPTTHAVNEYAVPYAGSSPEFVTVGPDGNIWFTDAGNDSIGVVTLNTTHFAVTQQPPASTAAGSSFGLTVDVENYSGHLLSSFNGTVTVALANNPGGDTLGGTLTATASNGVATFSGLTLTRAASGYTLTTSASGVDGATTNPITVTPAAPSRLAITQQPPSRVTAGDAFGLRATIEDPYGNVETGDSGSVAVSLADGPTETTLGGTLSVAASQGVASFSDLTLTRAASGYTLQVSRDGLSGATSSAITVTPAAPAKLVPATAPGSLAAGAGFGLTIDVEDPYGNLTAPSGNVSIGIASGPVGAALVGPTTATASDGVATYDGLTLARAGSYTLQASGGGLPPATIGPIVVTPAAPARLLASNPAPSDVSAGVGFGLAVSAEDAYGNPISSFGGAVTITAAEVSRSGTLGGTTTVSPSGGVAAFSGLLLDTVGTYTLQASSPGLDPIAVGTVTVNPSSASQVVLVSQPPATMSAGAGFGLQVEAEDPYGNLATGFDGLLKATLGTGTGNAMLAGPVTAMASQGLASFVGLAVDRAGNGDTIQVSGNGLSGVTTAAFDVTPAAATQLVVTAQPPAVVTAGDPFGLSVAAVDPYGNAVTSFGGQVTIALGKDPGQGVLNGAATATMSRGVAAFPGLSLDTAASGYTIAVTSETLAAATTDPIAVSPAAPAKLVMTIPPPTTMTAGAGFGLAVAAADRFGNRTTGLTGVVTIALANDPIGATLGGPLTETAAGGVANFAPRITLDTAGSGYTIQAIVDGLAPITSGPITVVPGAATHLVVLTQPPSSLESGVGFGLVVAAEDPYGNIDPNFDGPVTIAAANGSGAVLGGTATVAASQGLATFAGLTLGGPSAPVSLQVTGVGLTGTLSASITPSGSNAGTGERPGTTSPPDTGTGPAVPTAAPVTMTGVRVVRNRKHRVIEILVGLSGPSGSSEASNVDAYHVLVAGRRRSFAAGAARSIRLRSASYVPSANTVVLLPVRPFALGRPLEVVADFVRGPLAVIHAGKATDIRVR